MKKTLTILFLLLSFSTLACTGRVPSDVKTSKLTKKYFHKYGKKYKETAFHASRIQTVEVQKTQELQKNVATSFVLTKFENGQEIPVILTLIKKFPLGWRITGWEWVKR